MSKGGFGGLGDMSGMLRQAQKMQKDMAKIQEDLKERVVEGSSGGGAVKAFVNGQQELLSLKIDPAAIDPKDPSMLEDLVVAAVNQALQEAQKMMQEEMGKITGGLRIPGLFG